MNLNYSFIILTLNEEMHLPRLLASIKGLNAPVFILDSGSTDKTREIALDYGAHFMHHEFVNHPLQWEHALNVFDITTPWIVALDADQYLSDDLFKMLKKFRSVEIPVDVDGIYFNRKNYFKGKWIRFGGYFPKYMLKMFRTGKGRSSLAEQLDHRFVVEGATLVWKGGYLIEDNEKENQIAFWIDKHNRYSGLVARDQYERETTQHGTSIMVSPQSPDSRIEMKKRFWGKFPLILRPFLYFTYRYFVQLGFLDGYRGFLFHFLHAFWFRLMVDVKILEFRSKNPKAR